jgi:WD40 repeat protein
MLAAVGGVTVQLWNLESRRKIGRYVSDAVYATYAFTPDSRLIVSEANKSVTEPSRNTYVSRLLDVETLQPNHTIGDFSLVVVSPNPKICAVYRPEQGIELYDPATWRRVDREPLLAAGGSRLFAATFSATGRYLIVWYLGKIQVWEVAERRLVHEIDDAWTSGVWSGGLQPSPDRLSYVVSAQDFNEDTGRRTFRMLGLGGRGPVRWARPTGPPKFVFTPDGRWIVGGQTTPGTGKDDPQQLVVHSAYDGQRYIIPLPALCAPQSEAAITPDGKTLITCGGDGKILLWDWKVIEANLPENK